MGSMAFLNKFIIDVDRVFDQVDTEAPAAESCTSYIPVYAGEIFSAVSRWSYHPATEESICADANIGQGETWELPTFRAASPASSSVEAVVGDAGTDDDRQVGVHTVTLTFEENMLLHTTSNHAADKMGGDGEPQPPPDPPIKDPWGYDLKVSLDNILVGTGSIFEPQEIIKKRFCDIPQGDTKAVEKLVSKRKEEFGDIEIKSKVARKSYKPTRVNNAASSVDAKSSGNGNHVESFERCVRTRMHSTDETGPYLS